jgi:hypothetical protein
MPPSLPRPVTSGRSGNHSGLAVPARFRPDCLSTHARDISTTAEIATYPRQVYAITWPLSRENVGWAGFEPATSASRTDLQPCSRCFVAYRALCGALTPISRCVGRKNGGSRAGPGRAAERWRVPPPTLVLQSCVGKSSVIPRRRQQSPSGSGSPQTTSVGMAIWRSWSGRTRERRRNPVGKTEVADETNTPISGLPARSARRSRPVATPRSTRSACRARVAGSPMKRANRRIDAGLVVSSGTAAHPLRGGGQPDRQRQRGVRDGGWSDQHEPSDPIRVCERVPQRPHRPRRSGRRARWCRVPARRARPPVRRQQCLGSDSEAGQSGRVRARAGRGPARGSRRAGSATVKTCPPKLLSQWRSMTGGPAPVSGRCTPAPGLTSTWRRGTDAPASTRSYVCRTSTVWVCCSCAWCRLCIGALRGRVSGVGGATPPRAVIGIGGRRPARRSLASGRRPARSR